MRRISYNKLHSSLINASNLKRYHDPEILRNHLEPNNLDEDKNPEDNSEVDPNDLTGETEILEDELKEQDHHDLDQRDTEVDDQGPRLDPNQTYYFKNLLRGRFRHNRREIYVK